MTLVPFGNTAVAFDLIRETAHVLSGPAAWLCSAPGPEVIDELISSLPRSPSTTQVTLAEIDAAVDALCELGLLRRTEPYRPLEPPRPAGDPARPGRHIGRTHGVGDHRVAFRSDDLDLIEVMDSTLGDRIDEPPSEFFDAHVNADGHIDLHACDEWGFPNRDALLVQLPVVLNDHNARSHGVVVLHAGAVRTPDGRSVVLAGHADAGKSTLVAALITAGCDYLGDESISFGRDLVPFGYPKPLTLDTHSRDLLGLPMHPFPHLGPELIREDVDRISRSTSPVDALVIVTFSPHAPLAAQRLDPADALGGLCSNVLNLARADRSGLSALCGLAQSVPAWRLTHPGVEHAVPWILGL